MLLGIFEEKVRRLREEEEASARTFYQQTGIVAVDIGYRRDSKFQKVLYQLIFEDDYQKIGKIIKILFKVDQYGFSPAGNRQDWLWIAKKVIKYNNLSSIEIWYEDQDKQTGYIHECRECTLSKDDL